MIVCGSDFSDPAARAATVAAALAKAYRTPLLLVHAGDASPERLQSIAPEARIEIRNGPPADELVAAAADATLLVIGATGHRKGTHWLIGSTAERVAQHAHVPLLVVRQADALLGAIEDGRNVRVVLGTDLSPECDPVIAWTIGWREKIPSDIHLVYVSNPPAEYERLGIGGRIYHDRPHPMVEEDLTGRLRELAKRFGRGGADAEFTLSLGATSKELIRVAEVQNAALLVVGAHQRSRLTRAWRESVAHGVLHSAHTNVAVVPLRGSGEPA